MLRTHSGNLDAYLCLGVGFGLYSFVKGLRTYREYRVVEDTPEMPIRSLAMGLVRVHGQAIGEERVTSPVSHTPCYFYKVEIERWKRDGKSGRWAHYRTDAGGVRFYLEDASGRVLIDAHDAEFDLPKVMTREAGGSSTSAGGTGATEAELLGYVSKVTANTITSFVARRFEAAGPLDDPARERARQSALAILSQPLGSPGFLNQLMETQVPALRRKLEEMGVQGDPAQERERLAALEALRCPLGSPELVEHVRRIIAAEGDPGSEQRFAWLMQALQNPQQMTGFPAEMMPPASGRFRFTEYCVVPGHDYDVTGTCVENPASRDEHDRNLIVKGQNEPTFLISARTQRQAEGWLQHRAAVMVFGGGALAVVCLGILLARLGLL